MTERVESDDEARFESVWGAESAAVWRFAARRVSAGEVDDVVAETFVVVWRRIAEVPEPARPWLFGIARGVISNRVRSAARASALRRRLAWHQRLDPPHADASGSVEEALASLSEPDREVLMLIAWDGLSHAEVAEVLGCSVGAVKVRVHRARQRLRAAVQNAQAMDIEDGTK